MLILYGKNRHFLTYSLTSSKVTIAERQTIPHLNALIRDSNVLGEQSCCGTRGCHATSPLKSVLFRRKVAWQLLIELHNCTWHIIEPISRAAKWGIICLYSLSGSLSNPLQSEIAEGVYEELRDRVYIQQFYLWILKHSGKIKYFAFSKPIVTLHIFSVTSKSYHWGLITVVVRTSELWNAKVSGKNLFQSIHILFSNVW